MTLDAQQLSGAAKALISQSTITPQNGGWSFQLSSAGQSYLDELEHHYGPGASLEVSAFVAQMHHLIRGEPKRQPTPPPEPSTAEWNHERA